MSQSLFFTLRQQGFAAALGIATLFGGTVSPAQAAMTQLFYDGFSANTVANSSNWETSNWSMGAPFGCGW